METVTLNIEGGIAWLTLNHRIAARIGVLNARRLCLFNGF